MLRKHLLLIPRRHRFQAYSWVVNHAPLKSSVGSHHPCRSQRSLTVRPQKALLGHHIDRRREERVGWQDQYQIPRIQYQCNNQSRASA